MVQKTQNLHIGVFQIIYANIWLSWKRSITPHCLSVGHAECLPSKVTVEIPDNYSPSQVIKVQQSSNTVQNKVAPIKGHQQPFFRHSRAGKLLKIRTYRFSGKPHPLEAQPTQIQLWIRTDMNPRSFFLHLFL